MVRLAGQADRQLVPSPRPEWGASIAAPPPPSTGHFCSAHLQAEALLPERQSERNALTGGRVSGAGSRTTVAVRLSFASACLRAGSDPLDTELGMGPAVGGIAGDEFLPVPGYRRRGVR